MTCYLELLMGIWPNSKGMVSGWSSTNIVQMVPICCHFQKNILVWNKRAFLFGTMYIASLVVLCKLLHCDPWPFPQVSDLGPFGPSCFIYSYTYWLYFKFCCCLSFCLNRLRTHYPWTLTMKIWTSWSQIYR